MKRTAFLVLAAAGLLAARLPASAQQATDYYQLANFTLSGGDPTFPVTTDVTFQNLSLVETFADNSAPVTVALKDFSSVTQTSLDTSTLILASDTFLNPDPTHGAVTSATLTGTISPSLLDLSYAIGTPAATVLATNANFTATLFGTAPILTGDIVNLGSFSAVDDANNVVASAFVQVSVVAVPEPGLLALALAPGLAGLSLLRRRAVNKRA